MLNLFHDEEVITQSDNNIVTLTTHRIQSCQRTWGEEQFTSIMLEKISSVQAKYISYPIFLILGAIAIVAGIIAGAGGYGGGPTLVPVIIGAILIIAYVLSRSHVCSIASDGGAKILVHTKSMRLEDMYEFIDKIERAKNNRVTSLTANGL